MKKILSLLLCLSLLPILFACGGGDASSVDGSGPASDSISSDASSDPAPSDGSVSSSDKDGDETEGTFPNLVMANDQRKERLVVYDFDRYEEGDSLEDLEVWSVSTGHAAGLKFREDSVFGDVIVVAGTRSSIFKYPSGAEIWGTDNPGNNPHSIELLPSGNVVIANSTGNCLRLFYSSAALKGTGSLSQKHVDYELDGAHGVLWDPEYEVLWALGDHDLCAYSVKGEGQKQTLSKIGGMGISLPSGKNGGHDLSPDYTDSRYLYITVNSCVLRFDKEENNLIEKFDQYAKVSRKSIKGFSNNPNGNFFVSGPTGGKGTAWEKWSKASWCTDTIYFCYWKSSHLMYLQAVSAKQSAFYKVRAFCGQYQ